MIVIITGPRYTFINHDFNTLSEPMDAWLYPCGHMFNRSMGFPHPWVCNMNGPCADGTIVDN